MEPVEDVLLDDKHFPVSRVTGDNMDGIVVRIPWTGFAGHLAPQQIGLQASQQTPLSLLTRVLVTGKFHLEANVVGKQHPLEIAPLSA